MDRRHKDIPQNSCPGSDPALTAKDIHSISPHDDNREQRPLPFAQFRGSARALNGAPGIELRRSEDQSFPRAPLPAECLDPGSETYLCAFQTTARQTRTVRGEYH